MKTLLFILLLIIFCSPKIFPQTEYGLSEVKKIQLLKSKREDVRRLLSSFELKADKYHHDWYYTKNAAIGVSYSVGFCKDVDHLYDVSEWTAIEITISPNIRTPFEKLGLDLTKYKKEIINGDVVGGVVYWDFKNGERIIGAGKLLTSYNLFPGKKYKHLACNQDMYPY